MPRTYERAAGVKRWLTDPYERLLYRIGRRTNWTVASGPFAGMRYIRRNYGVRWAPQLIGCYEAELHPALERLLKHPFSHVVNVGAFEGYYAVGLALSLPHAHVFAFEASPIKQKYCAEMAALNVVESRIEIRGTCDAHSLAALPLQSALLICDCEGCEEDILNPEIVPWLRKSAMVVELHECYRPRVRQILTDRFSQTHDLEIIANAPKNLADYPVLSNESPDNARLAVREDRVLETGEPVETPWGVWTPRSMA